MACAISDIVKNRIELTIGSYDKENRPIKTQKLLNISQS